MPGWSIRPGGPYTPAMADPSNPDRPSDPSAADPPSYETLARRYLDLWQDQWTACAADPEMADMMTRMFQMMGQGAGPFGFGQAGFGAFGGGSMPGTGWDPDPGHSRTAAPPNTDSLPMSERLADDRQTGEAPPNPAAGPVKRQGPRPLALHLTAALASLLSSSAALPHLRNGSLPWTPGLRGRVAALREEISRADRMQAGRTQENRTQERAAAPGDCLAREVDREVRRRIDAVLTGIERYRSHPYRRDLPDPPSVWSEGGSRLLDYGQGGGGRPVLFVPSLVNRAYILDLSRDRSLMRWLTAHGFRPLLLDWGRPGRWNGASP